MRDLIDNRAGALYLTSFFFGHRTFTPGHVILPGFTCGQVIFPECPPSVDLSAQNRLQCGHFMLPAPAILWVKLHISRFSASSFSKICSSDKSLSNANSIFFDNPKFL